MGPGAAGHAYIGESGSTRLRANTATTGVVIAAIIGRCPYGRSTVDVERQVVPFPSLHQSLSFLFFDVADLS